MQNEQIHNIFDLCFLLNPTRTQQRTTKNKPTVFFDFCGHTNEATVTIYENGWVENADYTAYYQIDMDSWDVSASYNGH